MHTPGTEQHAGVQSNGGVGAAAKHVAEHASAIARLELELAKNELKRKVGALALGIALTLTAAVLALFMLGFAFATIAAAFETFLPTWLSLLIVTAGLLALAGTAGLIGIGLLRKGAPPLPEQAIHEARLTSERLRR